MTLISLLDAELAFGDLPLLDSAGLTVTEGERIGLIGRNGTGKSSLLGVIAGALPLDGGELKRADGLRVVRVEQEPVLPAAAHLHDSLLLRGHIPAMHDERERWRVEARLTEFLHRFGVDGARQPASCSGGERKRAALALAFALEPDLLLLDEPTNHLDIDGIEQLEEMIVAEARGSRAAIVITHDRRFLDRVATRIVELDRGALASYPGNFTQFEARKQTELAAEATARRRFDKFWAQEEAWIRKGIEARRTRNAGRVTRLQTLRSERAARRERIGTARLALDAGGRSGRLVAELRGVGKSFDGRVIVRDLDLVIQRGDRLALIGPNGAGKSTLLKLILGELEPDAGTVRLGTNLAVAYFDQLRAQLDPEKTVAETVCPGGDWIEVAGSRKHVMSYLGEYLFPPRRASAPVKTLSGGERNRLLLARLFALPANLLVLDEPTNDLDIESLELLESVLADYSGTLLLVSHDRAFLDAIATQSLVAEGDGLWREYAGGYSDWLAQRPAPVAPAPVAPTAPAPSAPRRSERVKLTFNEQRELAALPAELEALENEQAALLARMSAAGYHATAPAQMKADAERAGEVERLLEEKLARWMILEDKAKAAAERQ
ncbi:MAG: ATP-binding cassette domain-containing protein [Burkholderiales bacterium]|nr:ATP-binding cassette domain-containing protein [Burkholderiales bacterium]